MNNIFRNFVQTLRRFPLSSSLSLVGLTIAFSVFMVIAIQVRYEFGFDKNYANSGRIYRVEYTSNDAYTMMLPQPFIESVIHSVPQVEAYALETRGSKQNITRQGRDGTLSGFSENAYVANAGITKIFDYQMVEGSVDALSDPGKVLLPQSIAIKLFGDTPCVGEGLMLNYPEDSTVHVVGGVYRDFAGNTSRKNAIICHLIPRISLYDWGSMKYTGYVLLREGASAEVAAELMTKELAKAEVPDWVYNIFGKPITFRLTPVEDIYFAPPLQYESGVKGSLPATIILISIALAVIIIAAVNFVNFSTSLAPMRIKSFNIHKVIGCSDLHLKVLLVTEAMLMCLVAFIAAIGLTYVVADSSLADILTAQPDLTQNASIILLTLGVAVAIGFVSGLYPAYYITSFPPAMVLTGTFGLSITGKRLRTTLVGFQFAISIFLIIAALFLNLQNRFLSNFDYGYDGENIALSKLNYAITPSQKEVLKDRLLSNTMIKYVAYADYRLGNTSIGSKRMELTPGEFIEYSIIEATPDFIRMFELPIIEGRDFRNSDPGNAVGSIILNQTAMKKYDLTLGRNIDVSYQVPGSVIGCVADFNFQSLHQGINPMAIIVYPQQLYKMALEQMSDMYVKYDGNSDEALAFIDKCIREIEPLYPTNTVLLGDALAEVYTKDSNSSMQVTLLSIIAILISLSGVFGLVVFETQYRRKEIGIRKVYGATVEQVLTMFNRRYIVIIAICFVIGAPLAYIVTSEWLKSFQYKTPLYWWVFFVALVIVLLITVFTVTVQSWRAATANPARSLKGN